METTLQELEITMRDLEITGREWKTTIRELELFHQSRIRLPLIEKKINATRYREIKDKG